MIKKSELPYRQEKATALRSHYAKYIECKIRSFCQARSFTHIRTLLPACPDTLFSLAHMGQSKYTQKQAFLCQPAQFSCSPKLLLETDPGGSRGSRPEGAG